MNRFEELSDAELGVIHHALLMVTPDSNVDADTTEAIASEVWACLSGRARRKTDDASRYFALRELIEAGMNATVGFGSVGDLGDTPSMTSAAYRRLYDATVQGRRVLGERV